MSVTTKSRPALRRMNAIGVMPLAQPDPHAVRELPLERLPARAVKADRTDRTLDRNPTSLVERRQVRHAPSVPRRREPGPCRACHRSVPSSKWHSLSVPLGHSRRRPRQDLLRDDEHARRDASVDGDATGLGAQKRPRGTRCRCQLAVLIEQCVRCAIGPLPASWRRKCPSRLKNLALSGHVEATRLSWRPASPSGTRRSARLTPPCTGRPRTGRRLRCRGRGVGRWP